MALLGYALARGIEVGFFGLLQWQLGHRILPYEVWYTDAWQYRDLSVARLTGLVTPDPVNSAAYLLTCVGTFLFWGLVRGKYLFGGIGAVCIVALTLTWSRAVWLASLILLLALSWLLIRRRTILPIVVGAVFLAGTMYLLLPRISARVTRDVRLTSLKNFHDRMAIYESTLRNIGKVGLFGIGSVDADDAARRVHGMSLVSTENLFLQAAVNTGLVGGTAFVLLHAATLVWLFKALLFAGLRADDRARECGLLLLALFAADAFALMTTYMPFYESSRWLFPGLAASLCSGMQVATGAPAEAPGVCRVPQPYEPAWQ